MKRSVDAWRMQGPRQPRDLVGSFGLEMSGNLVAAVLPSSPEARPLASSASFSRAEIVGQASFADKLVVNQVPFSIDRWQV